MPLYPTVEEEVLLLGERVGEAARLAKVEQRELEDKRGKGGKRKRGDMHDTEEGMGVSDRLGVKGKKFDKGGRKEKTFGRKKKKF